MGVCTAVAQRGRKTQKVFKSLSLYVMVGDPPRTRTAVPSRLFAVFHSSFPLLQFLNLSLSIYMVPVTTLHNNREPFPPSCFNLVCSELSVAPLRPPEGAARVRTFSSFGGGFSGLVRPHFWSSKTCTGVQDRPHLHFLRLSVASRFRSQNRCTNARPYRHKIYAFLT